jgi:hypothetical protein
VLRGRGEVLDEISSDREFLDQLDACVAAKRGGGT